VVPELQDLLHFEKLSMSHTPFIGWKKKELEGIEEEVWVDSLTV
jgi:hypothetical protein